MKGLSIWFIIAMVFVNISCDFSFAGNGTITVAAALDTGSIRIGEQAGLMLKSKVTGEIDAGWFDIKDTIAGLDVVDRTTVDTVRSGDTIICSQTVILTAWDSGYYVIPPLYVSFIDKGDGSENVAETEPLLLEVLTVQVDTTKSIRDIKGLKQIPFSWQDALPYIFGTAIVVLLAWLGILLWRRFRRKEGLSVPVKPAKPPYDAAIEALNALRQKKLWQQGFTKQYYTELIDILRVFISDNWKINALEMTSDEILELHLLRSVDKDIYHELSQTLSLSDLVKFAKSDAVAYENERSLEIVRKFIELNKPEPDPVPGPKTDSK
jgi:hypothetical protein